jgi:DNA-binding transcriptional ArsR family regulator
MIGTVEMAEIAALVGDPGRANMLSALMDGRALTATELAYVAGVSPQTASGHLAKLSAAQLLSITTRGRYRYYRIATPVVTAPAINCLLLSVKHLACGQAAPRGSRRYNPLPSIFKRFSPVSAATRKSAAKVN